MKKKNILDLLIDDLEVRITKEEENRKSILKSKEDHIKLYKFINIFLSDNFKLYNLDFNYNINSTDEVEKAKSLYLLNKCIKECIDLFGITPNFYKHYEEKYGKAMAYAEICFRVLLGSILDYKKEMRAIKKDNASKIIESYNELFNIINEAK